MERFSRWIMLGVALLLFGAICASATTDYFAPSKDGVSAAIKADAEHAKADEAMSKWQDESDLVDHTGEDRPAAAPKPTYAPAQDEEPEIEIERKEN